MLKPPSLWVAVEEQYQFIEPESRGMPAFLLTNLSPTGITWREFRQDRDDVKTWVTEEPAVATQISELENMLRARRRRVFRKASEEGLKVAIAGTHPFATWRSAHQAPKQRFHGVLRNLKVEASPRLMFFTLHVQVGVEDLNLAVDIMNVSRYMLPHILAVSASSPFWQGENTGLKSYRAILSDALPRSGIPDQFSSWGSYRRLAKSLIKTNSIGGEEDLWWDVRISPARHAIDFRVCDANPRLRDVLALAALFQALVAWFWDLRKRNLTFRMYHGDLIKENRWLAARYGLDTDLVDFGKRENVPARSLLRELLYLVMGAAERLGNRAYLERIHTILETGTSADRQLKVYESTGSLTAVVDHLTEETAEGVA